MVSEYIATIQWQRTPEENFTDNHYSRAHTWHFDGGSQIPASSSPHVVPLPFSIEANVDPEEAFVAALSSCHMLFFLSIAAKKRFCIDQYIDHSVGTMATNENNKISMTKVILRPKVVFCGQQQPTQTQIEKMHHLAHENCYIANSVTTDVIIEIQYS